MSIEAPDFLPPVNGDVAFFYEGLVEHCLRLQKCDHCRLVRYPPALSCPACHSDGYRLVDTALTGSLHSFTIHHFPPIPPFECPHPIGLADMDDGYRLLGSLAIAERSAICIGMRVRVHFRFLSGLATFEIRPDGAVIP